MTFSCWLVARQTVKYFIVCWPMPSHHVLQNIFWNINQNRTRPASRSDMKRLTNCQRQIICTHYKFVVLCNAACDSDCVAFLKCISTDSACWNLASYRNHRNRIHVGIAQRCYQVCRCRTTCNHRNSRSTSYVGVTFGHVASTLLVSNKNVANTRLNQRVVCRQDAATW